MVLFARALLGALILTVCLATGVDAATVAKIFATWGQSNDRGRGTTPGVPPTGTYFLTPDPGVFIWNTFSHNWEVYVAGGNSDTVGMGDIAAQYWGPEAEFAHQHRLAHPTENVYIFKYAPGGTYLAATVGQNWLPSQHELFDLYTAELNLAKAALVAQGLTPVVPFIGGYQGEADTAHLPIANLYQQNKGEFYAAARVGWGDANTRFVDARININSVGLTYASVVRAAQLAAANAEGNAFLVNTDDLALNPDGLHLRPDGYVAVGARWFAMYEFAAIPDP